MRSLRRQRVAYQQQLAAAIGRSGGDDFGYGLHERLVGFADKLREGRREDAFDERELAVPHGRAQLAGWHGPAVPVAVAVYHDGGELRRGVWVAGVPGVVVGALPWKLYGRFDDLTDGEA